MRAREITETTDYFRRREREEKIISGEKPARKKQPSQTSDYARRREQERKKEQGVSESIEHNVDDLSDVADWMRTTPDKLKMVVKQEPIEKFIKQIREMYGTYDEFPEDEERTNRILKLLKKGSKPLPMYVEDGDPDLFVMEGRHRMVAFWLAGMKTIPVAYVSVKKQGVVEGS